MHAYQPERLTKNPTDRGIVLETFADHPALFLGAALSVFVMASILVNAIWYQPGKHPSPLFSTRNLNVVQPFSDGKGLASTNPATKVKLAALESESSEELLREVQTALSVRGYYGGKLDGVYGSRTRKAIQAFQKDHSQQASGKPSVRLLTQILMSASARPSEVPVPNAVQVVKVNATSQTAALEPAKAVEESANGLVARIQSGLRAYGYDDLVVDGKMGQQTATAIQRFQLDYGMKITGEASSGVLNKLQEIGAYRKG